MTLAMDFPGQDSLMQIYGTFLAGHFKHFKNDIQDMQNKILQVNRSRKPSLECSTVHAEFFVLPVYTVMAATGHCP